MDHWHDEDFIDRRGKPLQLTKNNHSYVELRKNFTEILEKFTKANQELELVNNNDEALQISKQLAIVYRNNLFLVEELFEKINQ
jgi:hypothetical protein